MNQSTITRQDNKNSLTILETHLQAAIADDIADDTSNVSISIADNNKTNELIDQTIAPAGMELENTVKDPQSEKGRQSKFLATFQQQEMLIDNFTSETKNLLARSAAVSINTDDSNENELSSEALTVKVIIFFW